VPKLNFKLLEACSNVLGQVINPLKFHALQANNLGIMRGVLKGIGGLTSTHSSTIYTEDHEGIHREFLTNEPVWEGGRVVRNLLTYSNDFSNAVWSDTNGTKTTNSFTADGANATLLQTVSGSYNNGIFSVYITRLVGTGNIDITVDSGGTWTTVSVTTTKTRFSIAGSSLSSDTIGIRIVTSGDSVSLYSAQFEDSTGRTSTTIPSEYIETTTAAVQEVFAHQNGNSVVSNVVTEARGTNLASPPWLAYQPALTNSQIYSSDLTNAEWTATTATTAYTSVGIAGASNSATRVTATSANGNVLANAITAASATHSTKWYIKRITGTGTIELTVDGGTTWQDVTSQVSASYSEIVVDQATVTNPQIGIRLVTSGDAVDVGNAESHLNISKGQIRNGGPVFTTTTSANTVAIDPLSFSPNNHVNTSGLYYLEWTPYVATSEISGNKQILSLDGAAGLLYYNPATSELTCTDGTNTVTVSLTTVSGTTYKICIAYGSSSLRVGVGGTWGTAGSYDGAFTVTGNLEFGNDTDFIHLARNFRWYNYKYADAITNGGALMS